MCITKSWQFCFCIQLLAFTFYFIQHLVFLIHRKGLNDAAKCIAILSLVFKLYIAAELQEYFYDQRTLCSPQEAHPQALLIII